MSFSNPVSRSDVVLAYRELLGREPESEETVKGYFGCKDVGQMRAVLKY